MGSLGVLILILGWKCLEATLYILGPVTVLHLGVEHQAPGTLHLEGDLTGTDIEAGAGCWVFIEVVDFPPAVEVVGR